LALTKRARANTISRPFSGESGPAGCSLDIVSGKKVCRYVWPTLSLMLNDFQKYINLDSPTSVSIVSKENKSKNINTTEAKAEQSI